MGYQFDHVRRGLSIVQEILDESYQQLIDDLAKEGFNENSQEISQILQDKAQQLKQQLAEKNRIIKALANALRKRPQGRSDWAEIVKYFETMNKKGEIVKAEDVENLVNKLMSPKPARLTTKAEDDDGDLYKCNTFSPFVIDVMTKENQLRHRSKSNSVSSVSKHQEPGLEKAPADQRISELTETLKRNVELSNRLQSVLQDLLGTIQSYAVPILSSLENLAKDITNEGNSEAVEMVSDMRRATETDLQDGSKLKSLLNARKNCEEEGNDGFDHYWSVRDSVELTKNKFKKLMKNGESDSEDNLTEDVKHLCKQMEISIREVQHTKKELEELQEMLKKYEAMKRGKQKKPIVGKVDAFQSRASSSRESRKSTESRKSMESKKSMESDSLSNLKKCNIEDQLLLENDLEASKQKNEEISEEVDQTTSERQMSKIFEGFEVIRKCSEDKLIERLNTIPEAPLFEAVDGTITERIDRLLFAIRRKISFAKRNTIYN